MRRGTGETRQEAAAAPARDAINRSGWGHALCPRLKQSQSPWSKAKGSSGGKEQQAQGGQVVGAGQALGARCGRQVAGVMQPLTVPPSLAPPAAVWGDRQQI